LDNTLLKESSVDVYKDIRQETDARNVETNQTKLHNKHKTSNKNTFAKLYFLF